MSSARVDVTASDLKIAKDGIRAQVLRVIRQAILTGEFLPGQRLVESDLCAALQVSRPSLREALRHLETERLVHFIANRGCFVAQLSWSDAKQIYETRLLLEPEVAARAASHAAPEDIAAMKEAIDLFRQAVKASDKLAEVSSSTRFYQALATASGNAIMADVLDGLNARISVLRARSMSYKDRSKQSLIELSAICDAVVVGNADAARAAASQHVENARMAAQSAMGHTD